MYNTENWYIIPLKKKIYVKFFFFSHASTETIQNVGLTAGHISDPGFAWRMFTSWIYLHIHFVFAFLWVTWENSYKS